MENGIGGYVGRGFAGNDTPIGGGLERYDVNDGVGLVASNETNEVSSVFARDVAKDSGDGEGVGGINSKGFDWRTVSTDEQIEPRFHVRRVFSKSC